MTFVGAWICNADRAFAWCDTEWYRNKKAAGHCNKLTINATSCIVGVGAGASYLIDNVARELIDEVSLDELIQTIPETLRAGAKEIGPPLALFAPFTRYFVIGWSHKFGRLVGFQFDQRSDFVPFMGAKLMQPSVSVEPGKFDPEDDVAAIVGVAKEQLVLLRSEYPEAGYGSLVVADIRPDRITTRPLFDFAEDSTLHGPKNYARQATVVPLRSSVGDVSNSAGGDRPPAGNCFPSNGGNVG